jgi:hypothetical protein
MACGQNLCFLEILRFNSTFLVADFDVAETSIAGQPSVKQEAFLDVNKEA